MTLITGLASPLSSEAARLLWLRSCCAVAEGADVPLSLAVPDVPLSLAVPDVPLSLAVPDVPLSPAVPDASSSPHCPPDVCVAAVLGDALRRVSVLGGREGMPRSLGSVYAASVTRFLGGRLQGVVSRVIHTRVGSWSNCVAVSRDGNTVLVSDCRGFAHAIHEYSIVDSSLLRIVSLNSDAPSVQHAQPYQLCVAHDDFVFVAERDKHRVQALTPTLDFHCYIGEGHVRYPAGVCVSADVVVVTEGIDDRVSVFNRDSSSALLRQFGCSGSGDGQLSSPTGVCFMSGDRHVAVADCGNRRVSVLSVDDGEFVRHVGVGVLSCPTGVACSAFDELVVADPGASRFVVFSAAGDVVMAVDEGIFFSVAVRGGAIFAQDSTPYRESCVVIE